MILLKNAEVTDFVNMTAYRLFSIQKCSGYNTDLITSLKQHSWIMIKCQNSIVTANAQSVYHQLQETTPDSSRLIWEIFYSLVDRFLWQVAPDNLKRFLKFGACFQLCYKLAVSLQHCTLYVIVHWVYIRHTWKSSFVMISGQLARSQFCALRGVARYVCAGLPSCWKMNPVGSRRLL